MTACDNIQTIFVEDDDRAFVGAIDLKELKFSVDYIRQNFELVANFLNVVILLSIASICAALYS